MLLFYHSSPFIRFLAIGAFLSLSAFALLIFRLTRLGSETASTSTWLPGHHGTEHHHKHQEEGELSTSSTANAHNNSTLNWAFNVTRDQDDYGLTAEQCQIAFPKLFVEIDRSVEMRREKPITPKEFETNVKVKDAMVRAMIYQGEVRSTSQSIVTRWSDSLDHSCMCSTLGICDIPFRGRNRRFMR